MTEDEKQIAAHLTSDLKDQITAYYVWSTVARRKRLLRGVMHRRARCISCGNPRNSPLWIKPGTCKRCQADALKERLASQRRDRAYLAEFDRTLTLG